MHQLLDFSVIKNIPFPLRVWQHVLRKLTLRPPFALPSLAEFRLYTLACTIVRDDDARSYPTHNLTMLHVKFHIHVSLSDMRYLHCGSEYVHRAEGRSTASLNYKPEYSWEQVSSTSLHLSIYSLTGDILKPRIQGDITGARTDPPNAMSILASCNYKRRDIYRDGCELHETFAALPHEPFASPLFKLCCPFGFSATSYYV